MVTSDSDLQKPESRKPKKGNPGQRRAGDSASSVVRSAAPVEMENWPVTRLKGVGDKVAAKLQTLGLATLQDVLFHLPSRYQDRTRVRDIGSLRAGEEAVIELTIDVADVVIRRRRALLVKGSDGSGSITLRFFHFSQKQASTLTRGTRLRCFSEVRRGPAGYEMVHPEYSYVSDTAVLPDTLTPFYPATEGVNQPTLRKLSDQALILLDSGNLKDWLPHELIAPAALPDLKAALQLVHRPPAGIDIDSLLEGRHPALQRLIIEELVAHRLGLLQQRMRRRDHRAPVFAPSGKLVQQLLDCLGFELTRAQQRVCGEIRDGLRSASPMLRLLQGDVGAGKTVVAAYAAALGVESGMQVALMAPTEILAEQHLLNLSDWFEPLGIRIGWLSGKLKPAQRRDAIESIAMGSSQIVVGTHALFQQDVEFRNLGLVIVDEQHRFGVHQRMALLNKGGNQEAGDALIPHQLIMTATPIPRTLAMTAYADLDISIIDELPPGRKPVDTVAVDSARREEVAARVTAAVGNGRQAYWVCTLIEESETLQAEAAEDTANWLAECMPEARVGLVHGRLKSTEKDLVMNQFKQREIDLLVATTVIEVGVDVPNASLMVIENAERLGLSQLHQLRGRVGRGAAKSSCILLYHGPLSKTARSRIAIMRDTNDGFVIAEEDLLLRGAGEVLGTRQTGAAEFRVADLTRDAELLPLVAGIADALLEKHPQNVAELTRRWIGEERREYGAV